MKIHYVGLSHINVVVDDFEIINSFLQTIA